MKNRIPIIVLVLSLVAVPALLRADGPNVAPTKIGIINIQEAIASTAEGKKAFGEIQTKFRPRQQELQRQQQEIQALQDQLQKQTNTLSDEEQRRLGRELEEKQRLFKRATEDADADYRQEGQDVLQRIGRKMVPLINDYAQQNGFMLVFDPVAVQMPLYYISKEIDLTEDIVKRYDTANPVQAEAVPEGAPATTPAARPASASTPRTSSKPAQKPKQ